MSHVSQNWITVHVGGVPVHVRGVWTQAYDESWNFDWDSAWIGGQRINELIFDLDTDCRFEELIRREAAKHGSFHNF